MTANVHSLLSDWVNMQVNTLDPVDKQLLRKGEYGGQFYNIQILF